MTRDYIRELRQLVGNRPLIMTGAAVLVTDEQGRLLLLRRTDNGCWGIPGGAMEPGETLEQTALRETQEETGLILKSLQFLPSVLRTGIVLPVSEWGGGIQRHSCIPGAGD